MPGAGKLGADAPLAARPRSSALTDLCPGRFTRRLLGLVAGAVAASSAQARVADEGAYDRLILDAVAEVAGRYAPPPALVKAVIRQESSFRPRAISPAGARGLMQVMPATARRVGIRPEDLLEPRQNIRAGVRFLATLLEHYRGDVISALVAYNARPRAPFAPVPRNGETPAYVWRVLGYYEWYSGSRSVPVEEKRARVARRAGR